jgi:uncharacterized protein (TIGR00290 family)
MIKEKIIFCWSGGKDSALALFKLQQEDRYEIKALLTTVTEGYDRISMHGVRFSLLEQQTIALNIPLDPVFIPQKCSNGIYEERMSERMNSWKSKGVNKVAFGDIFLEDLRAYRENSLRAIGMEAVFPLWKINSRQLADEFIALGFKAVLACIDTKALDEKFSGRFFDKEFLSELPAAIDPCGENGEFHTFVFDGPKFRRSVPCRIGETVVREGFAFTDLY